MEMELLKDHTRKSKLMYNSTFVTLKVVDMTGIYHYRVIALVIASTLIDFGYVETSLQDFYGEHSVKIREASPVERSLALKDRIETFLFKP